LRKGLAGFGERILTLKLRVKNIGSLSQYNKMISQTCKRLSQYIEMVLQTISRAGMVLKTPWLYCGIAARRRFAPAHPHRV
jgi:hypothetical protein